MTTEEKRTFVIYRNRGYVRKPNERDQIIVIQSYVPPSPPHTCFNARGETRCDFCFEIIPREAEL